MRTVKMPYLKFWKKKQFPVLVLACAFAIPAIAQDTTTLKNKITLKDAKEISYQAQATVDMLQRLLNYITFSDNAPSELADVIDKSYSQSSRDRIFYDKDITIEDDIDPRSTLGKSNDVPVFKYLNDLDVRYQKTNDESISFPIDFVSTVKKKEYFYIKVRFNSNYGSKYKINGSRYTTRQREALIRLDSLGKGKWQPLIVGVYFYDPSKPTESTDNDVQITTDTSSSASLVSQQDFLRERDSFILARQAEEKRKQEAFDEYVTMGTNYITGKQFKEALEVFQKAKDLKTLVPTLDKKIIDVKKLIAENTYENYKNKGDKAKSERKFYDAIQFYKVAITLKPEAANILTDSVITPLNQKLSIIALPNNKLQAGDFQGAIDECERVLHEHKREKNEYPELFYIEGIAYQSLANANANDSRDLQKALENFNLGITYFANYKEARLARAAYFVKYKSDYVSAITDYDVLTTNELDDSPDKPLYFVVKAGWKDKVQNTNGALADYDQAIRLSPANATYYFGKGELQYRQEDFNDAGQLFEKAIKLDSNYAKAYFYRGLNFLSTKNPYLSGINFYQSEKLGITDIQLTIIDSISNSFVLKGNGAFNKHDFLRADSAYDDALKIRNCNYDAFHGKAELRLLTGNELAAKKIFDAASKNYTESITLNKRAINCKPDFSDAHYKEGLAHYKIKEYELAINCYNDAIKCYNSNDMAYIERGNTYQTEEKYKNAVGDYNRAIGILTANFETANKLGRKELVKSINDSLSVTSQLCGAAYYFSNDYPNAMNLLNNAIKYNQTNSEAFYFRGLVNFSQGELSRAIRDYDEAIKISPLYKYYYANGNANLKYKNYSIAIAHFSKSIESDSLNEIKNKYYLLGVCYFKSKQFNESVNAFNMYNRSESASSDTSFYGDYGVVQLLTNQDTDAVKSFKKALILSKNDAMALYGLGCYYAKIGTYDKVPELIEKSFATHRLTKDEIKIEEEMLLVDYNKVKANRIKYNELKKTYLNTN